MNFSGNLRTRILALFSDNGTAWKAVRPKYVTTTTIGFWNVTQSMAEDQFANGDGLNFSIKVPILGWS